MAVDDKIWGNSDILSVYMSCYFLMWLLVFSLTNLIKFCFSNVQSIEAIYTFPLSAEALPLFMFLV